MSASIISGRVPHPASPSVTRFAIRPSLYAISGLFPHPARMQAEQKIPLEHIYFPYTKKTTVCNMRTSAMRPILPNQEKIHFHDYRHDPYRPPVRIFATGSMAWVAGNRCDQLDRSYVSMNLVTGGELALSRDNSDATAGPGDIVIAHIGKDQTIATGPAGFCTKRMVLLTGSLITPFLISSGLATTHVVTSRDFAYARSLFRKANRIMREKEDRFVSHLSALAVLTMVHLAESNTSIYPEPVTRAISFMRKNQHRFVSLDELAGRMHVTPRHCTRLFRKHVGVSPLAFFADEKLERARALLRETSLSVSQIGTQLGYDEPAYFSARFKKATGTSPSRYRNQGPH
ncbi:MAG: helix-turn-helix domain-containing protein [Chitinivibrionales bacterium]|nr:helix-turn-helix domain-containing protein [Chitinivibrionales bacterium]MBD3396056.1 helix-turn-helix domain-containing protein [Chitinivibrionales bacterium]